VILIVTLVGAAVCVVALATGAITF